MIRLLFVVILAAVAACGQQWHQIRVFGGINALDGEGVSDHPSVGAGYDIGLTRNLAITTGYTWNLRETANAEQWFLGEPYMRDTLIRGNSRVSAHDLMGGLRIQAPIGRVTPFVAPLGGIVVARLVTSAEALRTPIAIKESEGWTKPAAGIGAGFEVHVGKGWSILTEAKAIRPLDRAWYGHLGFGFAYRTNWGQGR